MSTNQTKQLRTLLSLRRVEMETALLLLQQMQQQVIQLRQRHDQLSQYRNEYVQQIDHLGRQGCRLGQMQNRLEFIRQLDIALKQAGSQIAEIAKQRQGAEVRFREAKRAEEVVKKLLEREREHQQSQENWREQKENDELGQKQWYSKPNSSK